MNKRVRARARARGQPAKQLGDPRQFTEAELKETKAWLLKTAEAEAEREDAQREVLKQRIAIRRQKLNREAKGKGCTDNRRKEIEGELEDLKGIEEQERNTGKRKHPSAKPPARERKHPSSRPSARELGFETDTPSVDEILEAAIIQRGRRLKKDHLIFAKLSKLDRERWGEVAEQEAKRNPKIVPTMKRIDYGDIKEAAESNWFELDCLIAKNYFRSQKLEKPLRELSADKASVELDDLARELGVKIGPEVFERALKRLCLVD